MNEPKFNLNGFTLDEIKNSGFNIVAAVWIEDNPDADEEKKSKFVTLVSQMFLGRLNSLPALFDRAYRLSQFFKNRF